MRKGSQQNLQYSHRLQSLKQFHQSKSLIYIDHFQNEVHQPQKVKIKDLSKVMKKIKVNFLVNLFIHKLRRNITRSNYIKYDIIQKKLSEKSNSENYWKPLNFNTNLKALLMMCDIFCILIIQTLSTFQGFYELYRQDNSKNTVAYVIQMVCLSIFFTKIIVGFITTKVASSIRHRQLKNVAKSYALSILFFFDALNFFTTLIKMVNPQQSWAGILCFVSSVLSLPVLSRDIQIIETAWVNNQKKKNYFSMLKILIFNLFFAQFVSTIFLVITYYDPQNNWILKAIRNENMSPDLKWWQQYFYAFYYAIVTITTVGYGDLTPANFFETIILSIAMLSGTIVFTYNITIIGSIMDSLRRMEERRKQQTVIFKRMVKDQNISLELEEKILDYIYKSAQIRQQFQFNERKEFLQKLPPQLRDQFHSEYAENIFSKIPFFKFLKLQTLVQFSLNLKGQIYYPGELMIKSDGKFSKIMFLKDGQIGLAYDRKGSMLNGIILEKRKTIKERDNPYLLNKYLLTPDRKMNYQIVAESYCFLLVLEYQDFHRILRQNKHDNQFYCQMINKITYIDQQWDTFNCSYCSPQRHSVFLCPRLHYMPYKSIVIQKHLFSPAISQVRRPTFFRQLHKNQSKPCLNLWKMYFKHYQLKLQICYHKDISKRIHQNQIQNNWPESKSTTQKQFILRTSKQILSSHCCQLSNIQISQKQLYYDVMYNFTNFFPKLNPQNFIMSPVNKKKNQNPINKNNGQQNKIISIDQIQIQM